MVLHEARDWEWKTGLHPLVKLGLTGWPRGSHPVLLTFCVPVSHENVDLQKAATPVGPKPAYSLPRPPRTTSEPNLLLLPSLLSLPAPSTCPERPGTLRTEISTPEGSVCMCTWFELTVSSQYVFLYAVRLQSPDQYICDKGLLCSRCLATYRVEDCVSRQSDRHPGLWSK